MRRAIIEVSPELLRDGALGPLFDAGLQIEASLCSPPQCLYPVIVLGISGDALPPECEDGPERVKVVMIEFTDERYGEQRIIRVSAIRPTGRTAADYDPPPSLSRVA